MPTIINSMGEFVNCFDPYNKPLRVKHEGPNDRTGLSRYMPRSFTIRRCEYCGCELDINSDPRKRFCSVKCADMSRYYRKKAARDAQG